MTDNTTAVDLDTARYELLFALRTADGMICDLSARVIELRALVSLEMVTPALCREVAELLRKLQQMGESP